MNKTLLFLAVLLSKTVSATIWVTLADPKSNKIAVVGASSGYIGDKRTMVIADNHGMAVVGSWYLGSKQRHLYDLIRNPNLSAAEAADHFSSLINRDSYKRRVSLVNARFENASRPGRGCHSQNRFCGYQESERFSVTGGGLVSENVLLAARDVLLDPAVIELPIECQLYKAIEAIFKSGGEIKKIKRLAYAVDDVTISGDVTRELFKDDERDLLPKFAKHLKQQGLRCAD